MKIIIAGAGEVGFHLAKLLSYESQDITLIDSDKERLNYAENNLDIKTLNGNASSLALMDKANTQDSDLFIAVTSEETTNVLICSLAKQLGCKKTIARIANIEYINCKQVSFSDLGVDELISPEELAATEIEQLLNQSAFNESYEFEEGALTLVGTQLKKAVPFVGKSVKEAAEIFPDINFMPIALQRKDTQYTIIPRGDTIFQAGDQVYFITLKEGVEKLYELTGKRREIIKNVMILGGGKIAINTARELCEKRFNVTIIEKNKIKAFQIADLLPNAMVIHGDGRSAELLEEEDVENMDAFISVTGNSETNIMSCLMAKSKNVRKAIALVENMDYFQLSHSVGIDTFINKKLLTANTIFRYVRRGDVVDRTTLNNLDDVEILEFIVKSTSKVNGKRVRDIDFPRSATIGGVIKKDQGIIALGGYEITEGDRIVVCCLPRAINKIENLFL